VGESIAVGQPLLSVELDKIDTEVPAPVDGTLVERSVAEGDEVRVGDVICLVES
jgi:2-oxoglutarate dehydrogenase E2 component (dihydrolipoamide succinyltransferase)